MTYSNAPDEIDRIKRNALIWTIVGFLCGGIIAGVLGLIGYLKADQDPETAKKFTKWAMIVTIIVLALYLLLFIGGIVLLGVGGAMAGTY